MATIKTFVEVDENSLEHQSSLVAEQENTQTVSMRISSLAAFINKTRMVFSNNSELKSFDVFSIPDNYVVVLLGQSVKNDEKGGLFYWDKNSTETTTEDAGGENTIISSNVVSVGRWVKLKF